MNYYNYKVRWYSEADEEIKDCHGIVAATNLTEAADKLSQYYEEESLEKIEIEFITDAEVLELEQKPSPEEKQ